MNVAFDTLLENKVYVCAVSGGVDSVVLLDMCIAHKKSNLIVAHFNHGIRDDADTDADFVRQLAAQYQLPYVEEKQHLGKSASEEEARNARYVFLHQVQKQHKADAIITAHHADDVVETIVLNILRGTGWRGLSSLRSTPTIMRPLLSVRKKEILEYANTHALKWREDATNQEDIYTRNYIRHHIIPKIDHHKWYDLYLHQKQLMEKIENEIKRLQTSRRYEYIMWPQEVAIEVLRLQNPLTYPQAKYALHAIKTAKAHTKVAIGNKLQLRFTRDSFIVETLGA